MKRLFLIALLLPTLLWAQSQPGSISGRIVTAKGEPAAGVRVNAITARAAASTVTALLGVAQTDADGRYRLEGVPPGRYLITAGTLTFPTYYPGVLSAEKATVVNLPAGETVTAIDFSMATFSVGGHLRSNVTAGQIVTLASSSGDVRLETTTNPDGSFRFGVVRPGTYNVTAGNVMPFSVPDRPAVTLSVNDQDIDGVEVTLVQKAFVTGSLLVENEGLRPRVAISFSPDTKCQHCSLTGPIDAVSFFAGSMTEGNYRVSLSLLPPGYFLKSLVSGDVDLVTHPFQANSRVSQPIIVTLGIAAPPPGVKVGGHVRDEKPPSSQAQPTAAEHVRNGIVTLSLLPAAGVPSPLTNFIGSLDTEIKPDGTFEFPMVPPGVYVTSLTALPTPAITVTVSDRELNNVDVVIPPLKEIAGYLSIDAPRQVIPPFTDASVFAEHLRFELDSPAFAGKVYVTTATRCDQSFTALFPEGTFSVTVIASGHTARLATYGLTDLLQAPLRIAPGDSEVLRVALTLGGARVDALGSTFCRGTWSPPPAPSRLPPPSLPPTAPPIPDSALFRSLPAEVVAVDCISCPAPDYPALARAASVSDTVVLTVIIAKDGAVRDAIVLRGHILLRDAAVDAVKTWRYKPNLLNGEPAEVQTSITVSFK